MSLNELTSNDTLKIWRARINEIISNLKNCAKINHASENKEYGCGDKSKFGHVKLSDSISLSSGVNDGIAATPSAVYEVYKLASSSIRLNEKIVGTLEITEIKGNLIGNAETSTLAEKAIGDELGRTIHETYTTKEELTNAITSLNFNVSSIKRDGTSLQWKDILSDTDSCFLYQNTYVGYMPALNLKTEDGRIGFGTYQDLCRWNYFKNDNQTNTPDSYIDLTSTGVDIKGNLNLTGQLFVQNGINFNSDLNVSGISHLYNIECSENITTKNLNASGNIVSNNISATNIHGGANSSFDTDLYVNSQSNSLIIRNNGTNVYLLVSDTVNGTWNSLRPFSFNMTNGNVTLSHGATIKNNLSVQGNINSTGTITGSKIYNAVFNDYAEFFEKGEETEVGDIIALDLESNIEQYIKASNDICIVGVHSDTYAHIIGGEESIEKSLQTHIPVGLCGRVKTKIIGKINKGDKVVLSNVPGVGRKYDPSIDMNKKIIGFSVEEKNDNTIKLVKIKLL